MLSRFDWFYKGQVDYLDFLVEGGAVFSNI